MTEAKILDVCTKMANELGIDRHLLMRSIYSYMDTLYDTEDVECWLENEGYTDYTDEDVTKIRYIYQEDYDCNLGVWDNIANAYFNSGLHLPKEN